MQTHTTPDLGYIPRTCGLARVSVAYPSIVGNQSVCFTSTGVFNRESLDGGQTAGRKPLTTFTPAHKTGYVGTSHHRQVAWKQRRFGPTAARYRTGTRLSSSTWRTRPIDGATPAQMGTGTGVGRTLTPTAIRATDSTSVIPNTTSSTTRRMTAQSPGAPWNSSSNRPSTTGAHHRAAGLEDNPNQRNHDRHSQPRR